MSDVGEIRTPSQIENLSEERMKCTRMTERKDVEKTQESNPGTGSMRKQSPAAQSH
jgi:hypothetical protein